MPDSQGRGGEPVYSRRSLAVGISGDRQPGVSGTGCGISDSSDGAGGRGSSSATEVKDNTGWS